VHSHRLNRLCLISLLTGKLQGISSIFDVIGGLARSETADFWAFNVVFPTRGNREFFPAEQGIRSPKQGVLARLRYAEIWRENPDGASPYEGDTRRPSRLKHVRSNSMGPSRPRPIRGHCGST